MDNEIINEIINEIDNEAKNAISENYDPLKQAIESGDEEMCETWRTVFSDCCGEDRICIRTYLRVIGEASGQYPFHVRYTLEKDENGKPLKAYGSATLVVDKKAE